MSTKGGVLRSMTRDVKPLSQVRVIDWSVKFGISASILLDLILSSRYDTAIHSPNCKGILAKDGRCISLDPFEQHRL